MSFNPLNPRNDLSCPNLEYALSVLAGYNMYEDDAEDAGRELSRLLEIIKAQREQMERTERAMADYTARDMKHVDRLCDIRDTLKAAMQDTSSFAPDRRVEAIKAILKKHFSLDLDK